MRVEELAPEFGVQLKEELEGAILPPKYELCAKPMKRKSWLYSVSLTAQRFPT